MADDITVVFGASLEGLTAGVNRAKEEIEGLRAPIDNFLGGLSGIAEVIGAAFAFEKISEWVEQVTEAAEKVSILSQAIGVNASQLLAFQNSAYLAGGSVENILRILQMVGRSLEAGLGGDPFNKHTKAIADAGLDFKELAAAIDEPMKLLELLRQAWQRLADTPGQRLEIFRDLGVGPRILGQLIPSLNQSDEQRAETNTGAQESGANLSNAEIAALRETQEEVRKLGLSWTGLKDHIVLGLKEPIDAGLKSATELAQFLTAQLPAIGKLFKDTFGEIHFPNLKDLLQEGMSWLQEQLKEDKKYIEDIVDLWHLFGAAIAIVKDKWAQFNRDWDDLQEKLGHGRPGGTLGPNSDTTGASPVEPKETFGPPMPTAEGHKEAVKQGAKEGVKEGMGEHSAETRSGKASWFGPWPGHPEWADSMNEGKPNASGAPLSTPGIALYDQSQPGGRPAGGFKWYAVKGPDGREFVVPQVDVGPAPKTGRDIDINAPLAAEMGYTPKTFPTNAQFSWRQATEEEIAKAKAEGAGAGAGVGGAASATRTDPKKDLENFEAAGKVKIARAHGDSAELIKIDEERQAYIVQAYVKTYGEEGVAMAQASKQFQEIEAHKVTVMRQGADEQNRIDMAALETSRKIENDKESAALAGVERRRSSGEITVEEAKNQELAIVANHQVAVEKIIAAEYALTEGRVKLFHEVENRSAEAEQKIADAKIKIQEKAAAEELKRAHDIDKEIASTLSSSAVDVAWGKSTPGAALASTMQGLEKKLLDTVLTKTLDASGVGGMLDKAWSGVTGSIFGSSSAAKDAGAPALQTAGTSLQTAGTSLQTAGTSLETSSTSLQTGSTALQAAAEQLQLSATTSSAGGGTSNLAGSASKLSGSGAGGSADLTDIFSKYGTSVGDASTAFEGLSTAAKSETSLLGGLGGSGLMAGLGQIGLGAGVGGAIGGAVGGKTGSSIGSIVGGLAMAALLFLEGGGVIPSAAGGMTVNDGMGGTMAIVHPNEMVLPSHLSQGIQAAINSGAMPGSATGGTPVHFAYSPTINAPEQMNMKQMLSRHGNDMLTWLQAQNRSGALRFA